MDRIVVCLFGPPAAGKTTAAQASGLTVYDRDEPRWTSERHFLQSLDALRSTHDARAVVIRTGSTSEARQQTLRRVGATHSFLMLADPATLQSRNHHRGRSDQARTRAGIVSWFTSFDHHDNTPPFEGWAFLTNATGPAWQATPPAPTARKKRPKRDITIRRKARATLARLGAPCYECGQPIDYTAPTYINGAWNPEAFEADHIVPISRGGRDELSNMRAVHGRCNRAKGVHEHSGALRTSGVLG